MERPKWEDLSQHDKDLLGRINKIDEERGWHDWPAIASLADELENEYYKKFWIRQCSHYNHLEEASVGEL